MENIGKFVVVLFAMIISPIITAFVLSKLWFWFIVPIFEVSPLRIVEAIGIIYVVNILNMKKNEEVKTKGFWPILGENFFFLLSYCGFALLAGWIVSLFM